MSAKVPTPGEQRIRDALQPFGWTCTDDFWQRYYCDPWVFNLANAVERLTAEVQRLREELRSEQMERSDAEREADRLREELRLTTAELHAAGDHLVRLDDEVTRLRAAIEKLRDELPDMVVDSVVPSQWVARRLTEMLEGDFQEQLDRARVKYRGALDELRDK